MGYYKAEMMAGDFDDLMGLKCNASRMEQSQSFRDPVRVDAIGLLFRRSLD